MKSPGVRLVWVGIGIATVLLVTALAHTLARSPLLNARVQAANGTAPASDAEPRPVEVRLSGGRFVPGEIVIPTGTDLQVQNEDRKDYTLQGAGILRGNVPIDANSSQLVRLMREPGVYTVNIEEDSTAQLAVRMNGIAPPDDIEPNVVASALAAGRQPVLFPETRDPAYVAYTQFDLTIRGEAAFQKLQGELFGLARTVESDWLPPELNQYLTRSAWVRLRPSVAVVVGLGPACYEANRFGPRVAAEKPIDLHPITYGSALGLDAKKGQRDVLIRVASDSMWFNQQACRYVWHRLAGRIARPTLDCGYTNPNGRSPILGGFFDGTGNPIGEDRDRAVFRSGEERGGTYMAWFRIRFDQERFIARPLAEQQAIIGRVHDSGRQLPRDRPHSHRSKTEGDSSRTILRQGVVYDEGPAETGILFASFQSSLTNQFEGILRGFMMNRAAPAAGTGADRLMDYMHFESGGYYYMPPPPGNED